MLSPALVTVSHLEPDLDLIVDLYAATGNRKPLRQVNNVELPGVLPGMLSVATLLL
jgi:hypothetical protein